MKALMKKESVQVVLGSIAMFVFTIVAFLVGVPA